MQKFRFLIVMILVGASVTWGAELRKLGSNDLEWATPNQGANTTTTSPQNKVVTKIDAKVIPFQGANGYVDDLVNGNYNLTLKPLSITGNGAGTISGYTITMTNGSLSGAALTDLSVPPGKLQASSWSGGGTKCYRDDGSWGDCGAGGDNVTLPITGAMIDNGTLNLNNFPADLRPIHSVSVLPTCLSATYPAGAVVYSTIDYKLYTCLDNGSWQTTVHFSDITGVIVDNALRSAIVGTAQFAQGVRPVQLVSSDPTLPDSNYPAGSFVFNIASNTLRKTYNGLTWDNAVTSIPSGSITGQLTASQIASLAASQITGQLTSDQIASLDGSKVVGEILATEIADNAVTTPKLYAGAVTTEKVAANAITSDLLAANSVIAGKISANAVEAGDIAANAVTAGAIAANAVTAGTVAAGAIGATEIAAGAIVAGKIGTDAITAGNIQAGAITSTKIATNAVTSDAIIAGAISAAKIATGAITADKIAANTITTDKLSSINSVSNDGNYMVSVGWYLNPAYLTTRYPTPSVTYFTADGQTHYYAWSGSAWSEIANIGQKTVGLDYYTLYATATGSRKYAIYGSSSGASGVMGEISGTSVGGGVYGRASATSGYGVVAEHTVATSIPIRVVPSSGTLPPTDKTIGGNIFIGSNGNMFLSIGTGALSGYQYWRTIGVANADLRSYDFAVGSQCLVTQGANQYLYLKATTGLAGWVQVWISVGG